jgi:phage N-6-adenine-methyltransferase
MSVQRVLGPRGAQDWETPPALFAALHEEFGFTVDAAADQDNALLPRCWDLIDDGLEQDWDGEVVWCNPPFNETKAWVRKAASSRGTAVLLIPASIDALWWYDVVMATASEVRLLRGRIKFWAGGQEWPSVLPRPVAVVIWRPGRERTDVVWGWEP